MHSNIEDIFPIIKPHFFVFSREYVVTQRVID